MSKAHLFTLKMRDLKKNIVDLYINQVQVLSFSL